MRPVPACAMRLARHAPCGRPMRCTRCVPCSTLPRLQCGRRLGAGLAALRGRARVRPRARRAGGRPLRCPWPGLRRTMRRRPGPPQRQRQTMRASNGTFQPERAAFDAALAHIQDGIARGTYYQVNHTARLRGRWSGTAQVLFAALQRAQGGGYAAWIDGAAAGQVLSVSPELFFDWQAGPQAAAPSSPRPMKGIGRTRRHAAGRRRAGRAPAQLAQGARRKRDDRGPAAQRPLAHRPAA